MRYSNSYAQNEFRKLRVASVFVKLKFVKHKILFYNVRLTINSIEKNPSFASASANELLIPSDVCIFATSGANYAELEVAYTGN